MYYLFLDIELFLKTDEKTRRLFEKYKIQIRNRKDTLGTAMAMVMLLRQESMCIAWVIKDVAFHFANDGQFVQSIVCYHTSILLYKGERPYAKSLASLESCVVGLMQTAQKMLKQGPTLTEMVKENILLLLFDVKSWTDQLTTSEVDEDLKDECLLTCLDCIQHCQGLAGDLESQIETLNEGILFQKRKNKERGYDVKPKDSYYLGLQYQEAAKRLKEVFDSYRSTYERQKRVGMPSLSKFFLTNCYTRL